MPTPLWTPSPERIADARMTHFRQWVASIDGVELADYEALHAWSIRDVGHFWNRFRVYTDLIAEGSSEPALASTSMPGATWFPNLRLNFAENVLERGWTGPALVSRIEGREERTEMSFAQVREAVGQCARGLSRLGVGVGDRVAGYVANVPEAIVAALACARIGAVWSSASPDFGLPALVDRFGQVEPVVLVASTHYRYKGRRFDTAEVMAQVKAHVPSVQHLIAIPYPDGDRPDVSWADLDWEELLRDGEEAVPSYERLPFDHPLYILFSSGTTGRPKCIVHGAGGTLLQHRKELSLHTDLSAESRLLYFTTCGWMMWNWQLTALSLGTTVVLYDGNPAYPGLPAIWRTVNEERVTHFGTSGRHIETCMKALSPSDLDQLNGLPHTATVLYTGSPLSEAGYRWVYERLAPDVHLAGISGGTDIVSCFVLGVPTKPVYAGEIQSRGLGVDAVAFDEEGESVVGEAGELVCRQPLPSMPTSFLNDPGQARYRDAYFDAYAGLWRHGDYVTFTERGGCIIHGRSDATLNPGGVRIGSAELYAALDPLDFVTGAAAVGWKPPGQADEVIVLFVTMPAGRVLDPSAEQSIRAAIRSRTSPRHVPRHVFQLSELPVTRSGKTVELSIKALLAGRPVKNRKALANPGALDEVEYIARRLNASIP